MTGRNSKEFQGETCGGLEEDIYFWKRCVLTIVTISFAWGIEEEFFCMIVSRVFLPTIEVYDIYDRLASH